MALLLDIATFFYDAFILVTVKEPYAGIAILIGAVSGATKNVKREKNS